MTGPSPMSQGNWEGKHFTMLFFMLLSRNTHNINFNGNAWIFYYENNHVHCKKKKKKKMKQAKTKRGSCDPTSLLILENTLLFILEFCVE